jgi:hypothetical protein
MHNSIEYHLSVQVSIERDKSKAGVVAINHHELISVHDFQSATTTGLISNPQNLDLVSVVHDYRPPPN